MTPIFGLRVGSSGPHPHINSQTYTSTVVNQFPLLLQIFRGKFFHTKQYPAIPKNTSTSFLSQKKKKNTPPTLNPRIQTHPQNPSHQPSERERELRKLKFYFQWGISLSLIFIFLVFFFFKFTFCLVLGKMRRKMRTKKT